MQKIVYWFDIYIHIFIIVGDRGEQGEKGQTGIGLPGAQGPPVSNSLQSL